MYIFIYMCVDTQMAHNRKPNQQTKAGRKQRKHPTNQQTTNQSNKGQSNVFASWAWAKQPVCAVWPKSVLARLRSLLLQQNKQSKQSNKQTQTKTGWLTASNVTYEQVRLTLLINMCYCSFQRCGRGALHAYLRPLI